MKEIARFHFSDTTIIYNCQEDGKNVEWLLVPTAKEVDVVYLERQKFDSLIQLKFEEDDYPKGFVTGKTMRNSQSMKRFSFADQESSTKDSQLMITTYLIDGQGNTVTHTAKCDEKTGIIETYCELKNQTSSAEVLEMFASFSLSQLSPFGGKNFPGTLFLNRFRSKWSMEGRLERQPIEYFQLEPSWKPSGAGVEKFGQVGSMPVRGFFPYICVEDTDSQVSWAVQLAYPGSWQLEAYRLDEDLCLAGGLADNDFGQWQKKVQVEEKFRTPSAYLTVCVGNQEEASRRLTSFHGQQRLIRHNQYEADLPVQFNEFCTTWGHPTEEQIQQDIAVLKERNIGYYVIDAGWYADEVRGWENNMGDWKVNQQQFPHRMAATVKMIRDAGMVPGIWFEFETVGRTATVFNWTDRLLQKNGNPITAGDRRFWDMRQSEVREFLEKNVIDFLKKYNFGYLKIDYNDNFGVGIDHPDSLGEGSREQLVAMQEFFRQIHEELPELVMENCSSGGHRLEPSMMQLTDISSFSDAHETVSIPIIAANVQQLIHPTQSLIWAVLRQADNQKRLYYSMCGTFLGRMCLSGDIHDLSSTQWQVVDEGLAFYQKIKNIILIGNSYRYGGEVLSYRYPECNQAVVRYTKDEVLVVVHHFAKEKTVTIPILVNDWEITDQYGVAEQGFTIDKKHQQLTITFNEDFQACALRLIVK